MAESSQQQEWMQKSVDIPITALHKGNLMLSLCSGAGEKTQQARSPQVCSRAKKPTVKEYSRAPSPERFGRHIL